MHISLLYHFPPFSFFPPSHTHTHTPSSLRFILSFSLSLLLSFSLSLFSPPSLAVYHQVLLLWAVPTCMKSVLAQPVTTYTLVRKESQIGPLLFLSLFLFSLLFLFSHLFSSFLINLFPHISLSILPSPSCFPSFLSGPTRNPHNPKHHTGGSSSGGRGQDSVA